MADKKRDGNDYGFLNRYAYGEEEETKKELWKPRDKPESASFCYTASVVLLALWIVPSALAHATSSPALNNAMESGIVGLLTSGFSGLIALALFIAGVAIETKFTSGVPPVFERVKDELTQALVDSGIVSQEVPKMRRQLRIYPSSHYDRKNKCYSIEFELNTVKATQQRMERLQEGLASAFHKAQEVDLERSVDKRGNQTGWLLHIFYDTDPYSKTVAKNNPFDDDPMLKEAMKGKK